MVKMIRWDKVPNPLEKEIRDRLLQGFWLPDAFPISNDLADWRTLSEEEKRVFNLTLGGLTLLDTYQTQAVTSLMDNDRDMYETANLAIISQQECYHKDTEILTPNGWKFLKDVNINDEVFQYNQDGSISETKVLNKVNKHFKGNLIQFIKGSYKTIVTPEHDMVIYHNKFKKYKRIKAKDLKMHKNHSFIIASNGNLFGSEQLTDLDRLYIALQADGCFGVKDNPLKVRISFKKDRKKQRLEYLLNQCNISYTTSSVNSLKNKKGYLEYFFDIPENKNIKQFGWFDLKNKSSQWCRDFLEEILLWNGQANIRKECVFKIQAIAVLAGYRTNYQFKNCSSEYNKQNVHYIRWYKSNPVPEFREEKSNQSYINYKTEIPYDDEVYCVTVPSGIIITKIDNKIAFNGNCVHSSSYSNIFMTLSSVETIDQLVKDVEASKYNIRREQLISELYKSDNLFLNRAASVFLETCTFYSGFYYVLYLNTRQKMINSGDVIRSIILDESLHGFYIGSKAQRLFDKSVDINKLKHWIHLLLANEIEYANYLYKDIGFVDDVIKFIYYNANRALMNLGLDDIMFESSYTNCSEAIKAAISNESTNHDFFSSKGNTSSYQIAKKEETDDDDWI